MSFATKVNFASFHENIYVSLRKIKADQAWPVWAALLSERKKDEVVNVLQEEIFLNAHLSPERFIGITWFYNEGCVLQIEQDLENANYLGINLICVIIRREPSVNLLRCLRKYLFLKSFTPYILILLPSSLCLFTDPSNTKSIWDIWKDIRGFSFNSAYDKLGVGIQFVNAVDFEFRDDRLLERWKGEPVKMVAANLNGLGLNVDTHLTKFLKDYITPDCEYIMCGLPECLNFTPSTSTHGYKLDTIDLLKDNCRKMPVLGNLFFDDVPQRPLKPTEENISASVYSTFERTSSKYKVYEDAITEAIIEWEEEGGASKRKLVILLVGAGRGGLVESIMKALRKTDMVSNSIVVAVEKNQFAFRSLIKKNQTKWDNIIHLINTDLRDHTSIKNALKGHTPRIVVSELLGSFGCNELAPDLIQTLNPLLDDNTVFLPKSYSNYIAPCFSIRINNIIQGGRPDFYQRLSNFCGRNGIKAIESREYTNLDQLYVTTLNTVYVIADPKLVTSYYHHGRRCNELEWEKKIKFNIKVDCQMNAFAGFFSAQLNSNIISIVPKDTKQFTDLKKAWFPAYFPLRKPLDCVKGSEVEVVIQRRIADDGMWYEWSVIQRHGDVTMISPVQNSNGESYFVRLHDQVENDDDLVKYAERGCFIKENLDR